MPRAGLTTALVVAEAARLADEVGLERTTLSAIAQRFGVAQPSLYKHVGSLDEVQRRLAILATRELGEVLARAAVGKARGDALRAMAAAYRGYARAHPGRYAALQRAPAPGDGEHVAATREVLATVDGVLAGYGLTGAAAIDAARAVRSALHGFVALEAAGGFGLPRAIERSFAWLVAGLERALAASPEPARPR